MKAYSVLDVDDAAKRSLISEPPNNAAQVLRIAYRAMLLIVDVI